MRSLIGIGWLALALLPGLLFAGWQGWTWWRTPTGEWFADEAGALPAGACEAAGWARIAGGAPPLIAPSDLLDPAEARRLADGALRAAFDLTETPPISRPTLILASDGAVWVMTAPIPLAPASMALMSEAQPTQPAAVVVLDARTGDQRDLIAAAQSAAPQTCRRALRALLDGLRAFARDRTALVAGAGIWGGWIALIVVMFIRWRRTKRSTMIGMFRNPKGAP